MQDPPAPKASGILFFNSNRDTFYILDDDPTGTVFSRHDSRLEANVEALQITQLAQRFQEPGFSPLSPAIYLAETGKFTVSASLKSIERRL